MIQCQILSKILDTKDSSLILLNNLNEEYFSDYVNEYRFIKDHLSKYGNIPDKASFLDRFPDFDILDVQEDNKYLLDSLYEDYNTRFLANTFNKIRELLNKGNVDEAMKVYSNASNNMIKAIPLNSINILEDTSRYNDYVERCQDFSKYYVSTGFKELDNIIGGWDREEELATIAARPGIGKSWILLFIAKAAMEQGLNVGVYSGEMSERKVGYRLDTLLSHISNRSITKGNEEVESSYRTYIEGLKDKYKGSIKVLTPNMINGPAGVTALRAFIEKENLHNLCVDQHSLLEDDRGAKNPVEKASNISKDLKNLQVLKRIPIIAVSQQNRSSTENGVSSSNIAQSDRISQDSTILIFLEQKDNILKLNLVKARDSVNNVKLNYAVDFDKGIFQYIPEEVQDKESCEKLQEEFEYVNNPDEEVFV